MALTREEMVKMDPKEVFEWEVYTLEVWLKQLKVTVGVKWAETKESS